MTINGSDGDVPSQARFSASSRTKQQLPIPDPHFFKHRGFERERELAKEGLEWSARQDRVVWRGALNGVGQLGFDHEAVTDPSVKARIRMVMLLRDQPGCDVRLTGIRDFGTAWRRVAQSSGLIGAYVPAKTWLVQKYAIDIDGWTNTWSNFLVRMLFGCCVFKVASDLGFRQWYYDRLKPFEHYVPVRADMSDFVEKIEWVRSHDAEARAIAEAGQRFATALDFEAGRRDAVEIISAHWND
ncbi:MAG: glycosyl transferase family 90 [Devosia sp.]